MSEKEFINNLSSVLADIRKLDTKKIFLNNKDILEYIEESTPTIKHSQDTRETVYEDDLWGLWVETKDDGTIIVHNDWVTNPNGSSAWNTAVKSVKDNKAYTSTDASGEPLCNIQTEMIKDGSYMFNNCTNLTTFSSDLSSLKNGHYMFNRCSNLESFTSDLPSLTNGNSMFYYCSDLKFTSFSSDLSSLKDGHQMFYSCKFTSFSSDLPSLKNGHYMFGGCSMLPSFSSDLSSLTSGSSMFRSCNYLETFTSDLPSLTNGNAMFYDCFRKLKSFSSDLSSLTLGFYMFYNCSALTTFSSDLPNLTYGREMFKNCINLTSFSSDLSSLIYAIYMFLGCKLNPQSVMCIVDSIRNITEEKAKYESGEIPWVTYDSITDKYSSPFGFMENGKYVYTYDNPNPLTTTIDSSEVGKLTIGIDVTDNADTIAQLLQTFAEECLCDSWEELKQEFVDKGWTVTFQYGGTTTEITFPEE